MTSGFRLALGRAPDVSRNVPKKIRDGILRDSVAEEVIARRAVVAVGDGGGFPRRFLSESFITGNQPFRGLCTPYAGPRFLQAGLHTVVPQHPVTSLAVIWARAIERGFHLALPARIRS